MSPAELKKTRRDLGLSCEKFATLVGVTGRTVRRWERGDRDIPKPVIILLNLLYWLPAQDRDRAMLRMLS
jgi:DNA-binding transcriptional regulator YiaG